MSKKGYWERWSKTSIANQVLVVTGILMFISSGLYTATTIYQVRMWKENARQTGEQSDKLIAASEQIANTATRQAEESRAFSGEALNKAERITRANEDLVKAAQTQANTSQVSASAAAESAKIAGTAYLDSQTPNLFIKRKRFPDGIVPGPTLRLEFVLHNSGGTAYRVTGTNLFVLTLPWKLPRHVTLPCGIDNTERSEVVIERESDYTFKTNLSSNLTSNEIAQLDNDVMGLFVYGTIWYRDRLNNTLSWPYCWRYDREFEDLMSVCPTWAVNNCKDHKEPY